MPRTVNNRQEWEDQKSRWAIENTISPELLGELRKERLRNKRRERNRNTLKPEETEEQRMNRIKQRLEFERSRDLIKQDDFQEKLKVGKEWESKITEILRSYGYTVEDVSERRYTNSRGEPDRFYPFDLSVSFQNLKFLVDVKYSMYEWRDNIYISKRKVNEYIMFHEIECKEKLLILACPHYIKYYDLSIVEKDHAVSQIYGVHFIPIVNLRKRLEKELVGGA